MILEINYAAFQEGKLDFDMRKRRKKKHFLVNMWTYFEGRWVEELNCMSAMHILGKVCDLQMSNQSKQ